MTDFNSTFESIKNVFQKTESIENNNLQSIKNEEVHNHFRQPIRVNLGDYAAKQAMAHSGYPAALSNIFNEIRCGHIIDETSDTAAQERHLQKLDNQVHSFEKDIEELVGEQSRIVDVNLPALKANIVDFEKQIHQLEIDKLAPQEANSINNFNKWKYGIMVILGAIYLIAFYISSVYMGMVRDIVAEATIMANNGGAQGSIFGAVFSKKAFQIFDFHWFSPILIFMFAIVLDFIWSKKDLKFKKMYILGLGFMTLLLDGFIAFKIEKSNFDMKTLMGLENGTNEWYLSSDFYIVLLMGFIATIIWGIMLGALKAEIAKGDKMAIIKLEQKYLKTKIEEIKKAIAELELRSIDVLTKINQIKLDIKNLLELKATVKISLAELERYITKIYDGWMKVVAVHPDKTELRSGCEEVYSNFVKEYIKDNPEIVQSDSHNLAA